MPNWDQIYYQKHKARKIKQSIAWAKAHPERARASKKTYYQRHKKEIIENVRNYSLAHRPQIKAYQAKIRKIRGELVNKFKESGCIRCGVKDIRVLDLHHKNPKTKISCVSKMASACTSEKTINTEINVR